MKFLRLYITAVVSIFLFSCASNQTTRDISAYEVPVNDFSRTVELLIANEDFLETEISIAQYVKENQLDYLNGSIEGQIVTSVGATNTDESIISDGKQDNLVIKV